MGYSAWGCKESDTTERLSTHHDNVGYHHHLTDEETEVQRQQKQKQNWPKVTVLRMAAGLRQTHPICLTLCIKIELMCQQPVTCFVSNREPTFLFGK